MDGSAPRKLVNESSVTAPFGVAIDFQASRLYWTDMGSRRIGSSDRTGGDQRTDLVVDEIPYGIDVLNGRFYYWLAESDGSRSYFLSLPIGAGDLGFHWSGDARISAHVAASGRGNQPKNRANDCSSDPCSHVCVLTGTSGYRCFCPDGLSLGSDGKTCQASPSATQSN